jgi:hypothetical protein
MRKALNGPKWQFPARQVSAMKDKAECLQSPRQAAPPPPPGKATYITGEPARAIADRRRPRLRMLHYPDTDEVDSMTRDDWDKAWLAGKARFANSEGSVA